MAMSKKQGESNNGMLKKAAALVATILVVVGVATVAYLAQPPKQDADKTGSKIPEVLSQKASSALLVVDAEGARLADLSDGSVSQLSWPDDVARLGKPLSQISGATSRGGQAMWLDPGFKLASSTSLRAPDGRRTAWLGSDRRDGGSMVMVSMGNSTNSYTLRSRNGKRISGVQLVGWTGPQELAYVGAATDTRWIYLLDMDGTVTSLAQVPEDAWLFRVTDGSVYYATAVPGEGLESPQAAPSAIWRVGLGGKAEKIVDEPNSVIQSFLGKRDRLVYSLQDGTCKMSQNGMTKTLGKGLPILDLANDGVLVSTDGGLRLVSDSGASKDVGYASLDSTVFYIEKVEMKKN